MKPTGKINPITGQEFLKVEAHDIGFWDTNWEDLTWGQKADYLSYKGIPALGDFNKDTVEALYYSDSHKER